MASSDSFLAALVVTAGSVNYNLLPEFDPTIVRYRSYLPNATASATITPVSDDAAATIKVNGVVVVSGAASGAISLNTGRNVVTIKVTGEDAASFLNYTVEIWVMVAQPMLRDYWIEQKDTSVSPVKQSLPPFLMATMFYDSFYRNLPGTNPAPLGGLPLHLRATPGETDNVKPSLNDSAALPSSIVTVADDQAGIPPRQLKYQVSNYYFLAANGDVLDTCPFDIVENISNVDPDA